MFLPAQPLLHRPNTKNVPFMAHSSCSTGPMAFLTQQNTKNMTHSCIFHVCILLPPPQPAKFIPPAATHLLHMPSPPLLILNTRMQSCGCVLVPLCSTLHLLPPRHKEHNHRVVFFMSGVSHHPSRYPLPPRHKKCDPVVTFFISGVSLHLSLHPLLPRHEEHNHMVAFFVSGVFSHFPAIPLIQT